MSKPGPVKAEFIKQLLELKPRLPKHYGVLVRTRYPHITKKQIDNTVQGQVVNWDVLDALKFIINEFSKKTS